MIPVVRYFPVFAIRSDSFPLLLLFGFFQVICLGVMFPQKMETIGNPESINFYH
uniref:Uncharacterized protein n=1 Tax=Parascaris equorum TaxID=6256 RepID=A0A914S647_PAREQ